MSIPSESDLVDDVQALSSYQSLKRNGVFPEALLLTAMLRIVSIGGGGGGGGGDASQAKQNQQIALETAIRDRLNAVNFATQPTLESILNKLIAAPATEAKQDTLLGRLPGALVSGRLPVDGSGVTQPVSVANFPDIQAVNVSNFPGTQEIYGTVAVTNTYASQATLEAVQTLLTAIQNRMPAALVNDRTKVETVAAESFVTTQTATIAVGATVSGVVNLAGRTLTSLLIPNNWTSAIFAFDVSNDAGGTGTYVPLIHNGVEYGFNTPASRGHVIDPTVFMGWQYLKVRSSVPQSGGVDRTLTLNSKAI